MSMPVAPVDPLDAALHLGDHMSAAGVSYAIGGALAYGWWAVPRATMDVDINLFVEDQLLDAALDALSAAGVEFVRPAARAEHEARGMFTAMLGPFRIDVFTPSIPFSMEAARTKVLIHIEGRPLRVLSAEAICVFKMLFFRPKDLADLERLVSLRADLDGAYVRKWLVDMMGEDDVRVQRWDEVLGS